MRGFRGAKHSKDTALIVEMVVVVCEVGVDESIHGGESIAPDTCNVYVESASSARPASAARSARKKQHLCAAILKPLRVAAALRAQVRLAAQIRCLYSEIIASIRGPALSARTFGVGVFLGSVGRAGIASESGARWSSDRAITRVLFGCFRVFRS